MAYTGTLPPEYEQYRAIIDPNNPQPLAYYQAMSNAWNGWTPEQQQAFSAAQNAAPGSFASPALDENGTSMGSFLRQQYASTLGRMPTSEEIKWYTDAWKQGAFADPNNPGMGSTAAIQQFIQSQPEYAAYQANPTAPTDALTQYYAGTLPKAPATPEGRDFRGPASGSANLGLGGGLNSYNPNPYLEQMSNTVLGQLNDNFLRNVNPQIGGAAIAAGQYGSSRQGVVQANALNDLARQGANAITGMYYGDYNNAMNRNLQKYGIDVNAQTAKDQLGYNYAALDANVANMNFDNQMAGAQFGLNAYNSLMNMTNLGLTGAGNIQNTPAGYWNNMTSTAGNLGGQGGTATQNYYSDPWSSAFGGATLGNQLYKYL